MDAREPSEKLYDLARRYWLRSDASSSPDPAERLRVDCGDLSGVYDEVWDAVSDAAQSEDLLLALIDTRRNDGDDLATIGVSWIEHVEYLGDDEILAKLRHRGVPAGIIAKINSHVSR